MRFLCDISLSEDSQLSQVVWNYLVDAAALNGIHHLSGELIADGARVPYAAKVALDRLRKDLEKSVQGGKVLVVGKELLSDIKIAGPWAVSLLLTDMYGREVISITDRGTTASMTVKSDQEVEKLLQHLGDLGVVTSEAVDVIDLLDE